MPRQKGVKNKITVEIKEKLKLILEGNFDKLQTELNHLNGKAFIDSYIRLLDFIVPKAKEEEITSEVPKLSITLNGINGKTK